MNTRDRQEINAIIADLTNALKGAKVSTENALALVKVRQRLIDLAKKQRPMKDLAKALLSYDALAAYIRSVNGKLTVNYSAYKRPDLVDIAHQLNVWNSNQPVTDAIHNEHYVAYILPIKTYLNKGLNR